MAEIAAVATAVAASAAAKAAKAAGSDSDCAIAPVTSGAGRRVTALNIEADERPTAGPVSDWRAASAKPQGTIGPAPTPISANPGDARAKALLRADEREARRRDRERRDDDVEVADAERMASALKRKPAWQIAKNAAPSPDTAASSGASSRSSSVDHNDAASSAAIETPMTTPSPISGSANESPWRAGPGAATRGGGSPRAARS